MLTFDLGRKCTLWEHNSVYISFTKLIVMDMATYHPHSGGRRASFSLWRLPQFPSFFFYSSKCLWASVWAGLSGTPPHPAHSAPVAMCLCPQQPPSLWGPQRCFSVSRVRGCQNGSPTPFCSIMLWSSSSHWPISVWPHSWTPASFLELRKMRIKRMISGLHFIKRWKWGAFRCGWSGVPRAAFTDHRAVHTAPCVTTVWRSLTTTAHGWTTALGGGTIVISFCSCSRSLFILWMCLASVWYTSSITQNNLTRSTLESLWQWCVYLVCFLSRLRDSLGSMLSLSPEGERPMNRWPGSSEAALTPSRTDV